MSAAANPSRDQIEAVERDLYARLGLTPNATGEELAAAYEAVQAYLGGAPRDLRDWAKARSSEVDEAYALLSDPAALAGAVALVGAVERPARQPGGPATPPARRATPPVSEPHDEDDADEDEGEDDELDEDEVVASVTPDTHRDTRRAKPRTVTAKPAGSKARARDRRARTLRRAAAVVVVAAAAVVIAIAGYNYGPGAIAAASQPSPSAAAAAASPAPSLDTATVATLMEKIAANPNDVTSLLGLANAYFTAEDYQTASDWATKATVADPKSVDAFVALGASQYNLGNEAAAEIAWKQAIVLDPKNIEAHYDLGFLYFAAQPQDQADAIKEWQTVVDLDPTSDLATSLKAHLASMTGSPAPSGSTAPTGSPAPSASAAPSAPASPAASPAASSSQP
jgi:cytochrome c-type biogenesis protein CcmH/NrfG